LNVSTTEPRRLEEVEAVDVFEEDVDAAVPTRRDVEVPVG
jgi:hypothetical protein